MARGMVNGSWYQRCAFAQAGVPSLLAPLRRDRLFSWPWIPDFYEVSAASHNCISDPHPWSVGMPCETTPRVWTIRVGHCRCGSSPDRQVRFGIEPGDVLWNRCPSGGVSLEHVATASRGIVFLQYLRTVRS